MSGTALFQNTAAAFTDILLPVILLTAGIYLTVKMNFVQIKSFSEGIKNTFGGLKGKEGRDGISPFGALATSLAAQLGTGNIVGAASAIISGGPGAVFWMWVSAFFGMAISYTEAAAAQLTKKRIDGAFTGGAAYYISYAVKGRCGKALAGAFSLFSAVALGLTGVAVQANSITEAVKEAFGIPPIITGIVIALSAGFVLIKGASAVARLSEKMIPVLALLYMLGCTAVIAAHIKSLPGAVCSIFTCAFSSEALFGGITGITVKKAITQGIKRGLFTNEAGMGSTPSAHALCDAPSPHFQGTLGFTGVFIDTFVVMSFTALAVITVLYTQAAPPDPTLSGSEAVSLAFSSVFGIRGAAAFIALSVAFFAFASILGWSILGKSSAVYLFSEKSEKIYTLSGLCFVILGGIFPASLLWTVTDVFNTLMVLTNIPALLRFKGIEFSKK